MAARAEPGRVARLRRVLDPPKCVARIFREDVPGIEGEGDEGVRRVSDEEARAGEVRSNARMKAEGGGMDCAPTACVRSTEGV